VRNDCIVTQNKKSLEKKVQLSLNPFIKIRKSGPE
jgi:hypothetical protein